VKVVLVATREDYYELLEEMPEFFSFSLSKLNLQKN